MLQTLAVLETRQLVAERTVSKTSMAWRKIEITRVNMSDYITDNAYAHDRECSTCLYKSHERNKFQHSSSLMSQFRFSVALFLPSLEEERTAVGVVPSSGHLPPSHMLGST